MPLPPRVVDSKRRDAEADEADLEEENDYQVEQIPDASPEPARRRIVDPRLIKTKNSLPARVLLAPSRFLAPRINSGLTRLENQQGVGRLALILSNPFIRPTFGGLGDGSGFGAGVYLSTANRLSENYKLFFSAHGTTKILRRDACRSGVCPRALRWRAHAVRPCGPLSSAPGGGFLGRGHELVA